MQTRKLTRKLIGQVANEERGTMRQGSDETQRSRRSRPKAKARPGRRLARRPSGTLQRRGTRATVRATKKSIRGAAAPPPALCWLLRTDV